MSRCPLAEVYPLAKVGPTAQLSQRIKIGPEIQETRHGSSCDPNWEALSRASRLSGCVISGINTAVFVSLSTAPDRAAAWPAACSWSLAPWDGRTPPGSGEHAPPKRPPRAAIQADQSGLQFGAPREASEETREVLRSQEGEGMWRNLQVFSLWDGGWSQSPGQSRVISCGSILPSVGSPCASTLRR